MNVSLIHPGWASVLERVIPSSNVLHKASLPEHLAPDQLTALLLVLALSLAMAEEGHARKIQQAFRRTRDPRPQMLSACTCAVSIFTGRSQARAEDREGELSELCAITCTVALQP